MSQRFLFEEDYKWPVKIMRAVIWSGTMGFLWVIPWIFFVLSAVLCSKFVESRHPAVVGEYDEFGWVFVFMVMFHCVIFTFVVGAVIGLSAGIEAQPEEPFSPLYSSRLRSTFEWVAGIVFVMFLGVVAVVVTDFVPSSIF
ncbi:hypothetical protein IAD21_06259 [Abditibacteriota bacterium]|nr:hypothetical protein IAD21_06259 [Abditibacteriota bacterium]